MSYSPTDLLTILQSVQAALIAGMTTGTFSTSNCFLSDAGVDDTAYNPGDASGAWLRIYSSDGMFEQGLIAGGGNQQCTMTQQFAVEFCMPLFTDQQGRDALFLAAANPYLKEVVKIVSMLSPTAVINSVTYTQIVREPMRPLKMFKPQHDDELRTSSVMIIFECMFDWDLS
jgi:hypothetical protein